MSRATAAKPTRPGSTRAASTAAAAALQDYTASGEREPKPPKSPKKKTAAKPLEQDEQDWAREMLRRKMAALAGGSASPVPAPAPASTAAAKPAKSDAGASKEKASKEDKAEEKKKSKKKKKQVVAKMVALPPDDDGLVDEEEPPKKKVKSKGKGKEKAVEPETSAAKPPAKASSSVAVVIPAKPTAKVPATPTRNSAPDPTSSPAVEVESPKKARRKDKKKAEKAAADMEQAQPAPTASQAQSEVDPAEKERKRKERKEKKKAKKAEEKKRKEAEESQQAEQVEPPAKKKDKGKGKAVEAVAPVSPVKKAGAPASAAASKKRKRAESPAPYEAGPSRAAAASTTAKTNTGAADRKHKKRKVDATAAVATQTTTEVILHPASPAALAAAKTSSPFNPVLSMVLGPFMMPHVNDEQQNKALVEQLVQNFVDAGYSEQVDKVMRGVKRSRTGEERQVSVAPITDANAVAGPSGTSTSARAPAQAAAKDTPASVAPASSPLRTVKPPASSAPQPTPPRQRGVDETPAASTRSSSPALSALGLALNGSGNGSDGGKKRRVRPSKAARKAMSQASQSQPNTDVEDGNNVRKTQAAKAAAEAPKQVEPVAVPAADETQVVPKTVEVESREPSTEPDDDDQLDPTPRPAERKAEAAMDVDAQEVEPEAAQQQSQAEQKQAEAEEADESDEELDELDSTPATPALSATYQPQRSNPAVTRVVESDSRAVTPSTSEDDDEEVQLSLKAHASPASAKKKDPEVPVEPEEAPLPPAAQTPSRNAQEEEDEEKLSRAANTRLPSSSPGPALPTIGGKRNAKGSDESSSSSSEDESDESSDEEAAGSSSLLTRNAAQLRNGTGGRPSLSLLAKEAFSKPKKRGSLLGGAGAVNKVLASSAVGYAGSPLKHSPLNAASSSPARTDGKGAAQEDEEEEIDQLLSQTQPSQRPKRTSDAYWAQLEREEEEKKKRKGKDKKDETSDDEEDEDAMAVDGDTAAFASLGQTRADVAEPEEADAAETAAAVNGAPATGEAVFANASRPAPRPSANDAGAPPITTAVENGAGPSSSRHRLSPSPQPLPDVPAAAVATSFLSPTQPSQRPPDRIYPDLSSIGNLPTSSQAGSPPIEVDDPSQVYSGEERPPLGDDDDEEQEAQRAPAESQFVPLQKDKPLFLETQTQAPSQEDGQLAQDDGAEAETEDAEKGEAPADDEAEEEGDEESAILPIVKVNGSARAPPTPDASTETSPAPPAIVEPDRAEEGTEDEEDDGPTPKAAAASPAKESAGLAVPPKTPARITRASSARLASRSPSAEAPQAASQPVNGTPASPRRTHANRKKPESVATSASNSARMPHAAISASQPITSTPSTLASGSRASRMLPLSQLDTVKQPARRTTRASLAASASQPTTSQKSFIARDSDDEDDDEEEAASSGEEEAGKGKGKARKTHASMSQPVPGTQANGKGRRSKRQSDLWR